MGAATESPTLVEITLTSKEKTTKTLSPAKLQTALAALHNDGIVVITNAVDPSHLDKLNSRMVPEAQALYDRPSTHRNFGVGNIQQEPVNDPDYIFDDVIANPWATAITEFMLGPNPRMRFYSANTAFKSDLRQPVHSDMMDWDHPRFPFAYAINVALVDVSAENGSTEIWPGSHIDSTLEQLEERTGGVLPDLVEARRKISPPLQPRLPKGAVIIRDFRLWHAGMPNRTEDPRVMLVTAHFPSWFQSDLEFVLPKSTKGKIDWGRLVPCVEYVDDDYDYLLGRHDHDFRQKAVPS